MSYVAAIFSSLIFLTLASPTFASSIKITPENFSLKSSVGEAISETILVENGTNEPKNITLVWKPKGVLSHSIDFAQINPNSILINPNTITQVEVVLTIPGNLKPGDYFGSLVAFSEEQEVAKSEFQLRILGTTTRSVTIKSFKYQKDLLSIKITNSGDLKEQISLTTETTSFFGILNEKINRKLGLLPEETREIVSKQPLLPGYYATTITLEYGDKTQTEVFSFWSLNAAFFAALGVLILLIVFLILKMFKRTW